jgi:hypothetical protein
MRRRWVIPLFILIVLVIAFGFRWKYGPTTIHNSGAIKVQHNVDRWTGRPWVVVNGAENFNTYSNHEVPYMKTGAELSTDEGKENARKERNKMTKIWVVLVGLASVLTVYYYMKGHQNTFR